MHFLTGRRTPLVAALLSLAVVVGLLQLPAGQAQAASTITYTYEVRGRGNVTSLEDFAKLAAQTYADPRGWGLGGSIRFVRVAGGGDFTLWLSAARHLPAFSSGCSVEWSCRVGRNVIINETRFRGASPSWNAARGSLRDYQHMVVNHETGHWLGFGHASCPAAGGTAPVMQQQSKSLQGCRFNPWPTASERSTLSARKKVPIVVPPSGPPRVAAGAITKVAAAGKAGIPADAEAVGVNLAVTAPANAGYATVFPCGSPVPGTSNLNFAAGQTIAGFTLAKPGPDGSVCVRASATTHLVVDVTGFVPAGSAYEPLAGTRLLDSRRGGQRVSGTTAIQLPAGVGTAGLTVAVTGPVSQGYLTMHPCGTPRPLASTLNFTAGSTIANFALASVGTDGRVCVYSTAATHLVVDLVGTYPKGSGLPAAAPLRLLDTRSAPIRAGVTPVALPGGGQHMLNLAVTAARGQGWARIYPCSAAQPATSNINFVTGQTVANAAIGAADSSGRMCVAASAPVHVVIDDAGPLSTTDYGAVPATRLLDTRRK